MWDPILFWNDVLLEANRRDHSDAFSSGDQRGPTATSRAFAIVHLAMHDAWFGLHSAADVPGTYTREALKVTAAALPDARNASVSAAAHDTLVALYPKLKALVDAAQATVAANGPLNAAGLAFGAKVATEMLRLRDNDGSTAATPHVPSNAKGHHRVDPANPTQGYLGPAWGRVKHFVVNTDPGLKHIHLAPPPGYGLPDMFADDAYAQSYVDVLARGRKTGSTRSPDETTSAIFWAYDGANEIGTPPRLYNQILCEISENAGHGPEDNALLFALANVAMADAGIDAWHWKYHYDLWRPVLGIREADASLGPVGTAAKTLKHGDPSWLPLGAPKSNQKSAPDFTPNFPAYPSGHATFGAAMFQVVRMFKGAAPALTLANIVYAKRDDVGTGFEFVSDELNGATTDSAGVVRPRHRRRFDNIEWAIRENSLSRVRLGVHWDFDGFAPTGTADVGGVPLGLEIGRRVSMRGLLQV